MLIAYMVFEKKIKFNKQAIIEFGLWSIMICTFFLPSMHERYLFVGDILSLIYFIYNKDKVYIPIGISFVSLYGYCNYLFGKIEIPIQYVSILYFILILIVSKDIIKKYFRDKTDSKAIN